MKVNKYVVRTSSLVSWGGWAWSVFLAGFLGAGLSFWLAVIIGWSGWAWSVFFARFLGAGLSFWFTGAVILVSWGGWSWTSLTLGWSWSAWLFVALFAGRGGRGTEKVLIFFEGLFDFLWVSCIQSFEELFDVGFKLSWDWLTDLESGDLIVEGTELGLFDAGQSLDLAELLVNVFSDILIFLVEDIWLLGGGLWSLTLSWLWRGWSWSLALSWLWGAWGLFVAVIFARLGARLFFASWSWGGWWWTLAGSASWGWAWLFVAFSRGTAFLLEAIWGWGAEDGVEDGFNFSFKLWWDSLARDDQVVQLFNLCLLVLWQLLEDLVEDFGRRRLGALVDWVGSNDGSQQGNGNDELHS
jgi:hypothetical protein